MQRVPSYNTTSVTAVNREEEEEEEEKEEEVEEEESNVDTHLQKRLMSSVPGTKLNVAPLEEAGGRAACLRCCASLLVGAGAPPPSSPGWHRPPLRLKKTNSGFFLLLLLLLLFHKDRLKGKKGPCRSQWVFFTERKRKTEAMATWRNSAQLPRVVTGWDPPLPPGHSHTLFPPRVRVYERLEARGEGTWGQSTAGHVWRRGARGLWCARVFQLSVSSFKMSMTLLCMQWRI